MDAKISKFTTSDGYPLKYRHWRADGRPSHYVVALHGIQSHSGWFEFSSRRLALAGVDVRFLDRRGSGLNGRDRGHVVHHDRAINDVVQFVRKVRTIRDDRAPEAPVILLGLSWGGRLAAAGCAHRPQLVEALALLYPGICARIGPSGWQRMQLWLARRLGVKRKYVRVPLDDAKLFTGEPSWQQFIEDDPLALRFVTTSFLQASQHLTRLALAAAEHITCPSLLMLAGQDRISDVSATRHWFDRLATDKRTLIEYPQAQHTLEFEPDRVKFVADLIDWVQSVRPSPTSAAYSSASRKP